MTDSSPTYPAELAAAIELERAAPAPPDDAALAVRREIDRTIAFAPDRFRWFRERVVPNALVLVAFALALGAIILLRVPRSHFDPHGMHPLGTSPDDEAITRRAVHVTPLRGIDAGPPLPRSPELLHNESASQLLPWPVVRDVPDAAVDAAGAPRIDRHLEEAALLDMAERALAQHDVDAAVVALRMHLGRFPDGQMEAQREVLVIRTLVLATRVDEARARAARFRLEHPASPANEMIDTLLPR